MMTIVRNDTAAEHMIPTKLFVPPQRHSLIPRPRLINRLNRQQFGKLTVVVAPAGFGKTTLVTTWLTQLSTTHNQETASNHTSVAWLSLDTDDNRFVRFFTYFIAAVQTVDSEFAQALLSSLQLPSPPSHNAFVQKRLHELTRLDRPLLIVLDDYHTITNDEIHEALRTLIDYMPFTMHLVITSRAEPPFPLARLRVQDQLVEIRAADLRCTLDEAKAFFEQTMGLQLTESAIAKLEERTEGWIAGLQLAALSLRDAPDTEQFLADFRGDHRQIADYLLEEVFRHQPPEVQNFLLQTAVLTRFCADLCDDLAIAKDVEIDELHCGCDENMVFPTARPDKAKPCFHTELGLASISSNLNAQQIVDYLENANLFLIPLDARRRWYRYHHLFAQLLQDRLIRTRGQEWRNLLHKRASRWFADQQLMEEAIAHAVEGQDFDGAARLVATVPLESLWGQQSASLLKQWGPMIPTKFLLRHPHALVSVAAAHLFMGDVDHFNNLLGLCEDLQREDIESIAGEYTLFQCIQCQSSGDFRRALHLAEEAGEILSDRVSPLQAVAMNQIAASLLQLGDLALAEQMLVKARRLIAQVGAPSLDIHLQIISTYGSLALMRADHRQAHRLYREGVVLVEQADSPPPPRLGFMYTGLGQVHYERNELDEATAAYAQARTWAARSGLFDLRMHTLVGEIALLCQKGDAAAAQSRLAEYHQSGYEGHYQHMTHLTESVVANFRLRLGELDEAVRWADTCGFGLTDRPDNGLRFFTVAAKVGYKFFMQTEGCSRISPLMVIFCPRLLP
ncbi:AAA family ATPase [Chloroflexi bacterium TSY]|nr:AAA family ATPase [Chloroflexi bacterium TSY]